MRYEDEVRVTKDTIEAIQWYVVAAGENDETAMKVLRLLFSFFLRLKIKPCLHIL
jgi:hypothetical protein